MSDDFSLGDALSGQSNANNLQSQGQGQYNPWGGQNPGYQGSPGQQNPGFPAPGQGQPYPGFPAQGQGQPYPGFPAQGQGQPYPGFPAQGQGQPYPGFPGFPGPGQSYPGAPTPGQPTPAPSAPSGPLKVPYEIPLPSGCTKGMVLTVCGIPNGKRFSIDYKEGDNIAFHFNPRFDERPNVIVRNSMIRGEWGSEERPCPKFPFVHGQSFKLQILFDVDSFKVAVNNENLCQYQHRLRDFSRINNIRICGDLTISEATIYSV